MISWIIWLFVICVTGQRLIFPRDAYSNPSHTNNGPKSYFFQYFVKLDDRGGQHSRSESSEVSGKVQGCYTLNNGQGHYRRVNYTADENGFRATVMTNEPGVGKQNPAFVTINSGDGINNVENIPIPLQYLRCPPANRRPEILVKLQTPEIGSPLNRTIKPPPPLPFRTTVKPLKPPNSISRPSRPGTFNPSELHRGRIVGTFTVYENGTYKTVNYTSDDKGMFHYDVETNGTDNQISDIVKTDSVSGVQKLEIAHEVKTYEVRRASVVDSK